MGDLTNDTMNNETAWNYDFSHITFTMKMVTQVTTTFDTVQNSVTYA